MYHEKMKNRTFVPVLALQGRVFLATELLEVFIKREEIVLLRLNPNDACSSMVLCFYLLSGASLLSQSDKTFLQT